jgi:hypothetical protein
MVGEYSNANSLMRRLMSLYLYATGSQRQPISVLAHLGLSESYTNLISKPRIIGSDTACQNVVLAARDSRTSSVQPSNPSTTQLPAGKTTSPPTAETLPVHEQPASITVPNVATTSTQTQPPGPDLPKYRKPGILRQLSGTMRDSARRLASTGLFAMSYDNINMMLRTGEQIMGRNGNNFDYSLHAFSDSQNKRQSGKRDCGNDLAIMESESQQYAR